MVVDNSNQVGLLTCVLGAGQVRGTCSSSVQARGWEAQPGLFLHQCWHSDRAPYSAPCQPRGLSKPQRLPWHHVGQVGCWPVGCDLLLLPQVVGLVTRKDLARYRLGKGGLEELSLAQT